MAERYWVGGSATWDGTAGSKWALTSGGAGGQAVPTSSDNVYFDAGSGTCTVTTSGTSTDNCANLTWSSANVTLSHASSTTINVYGSMDFTGSGTYTRGSAVSSNFAFRSTATGKTIKWASKSPANVTFDGVGGGWQFQDGLTLASTADNITLTNGAIDFNGQAISGGLSSNNTNTRSITMGAMTFTVQNGAAALWDITDSTGMTLSAASATISSSNTTNAFAFNGGGLTYGTLSATALNTTGSTTINQANTFATLTLGNSTSDRPSIQLGANQTVTGTLTVTGNSIINRAFIRSTVRGTQRTISAATVTTTNSDWQDINGTGAGSWNLASISGGSGDCGGCTGLTFTTPGNQYWVPSGGTSTGTISAATRWASADGGTAGTGRAPLPQDTAYFTASSIDAGSRTITHDKSRMSAYVFTGVTNTPQFTCGTVTSLELYGSITLVTGMTITNTINSVLAGRGTPTITFAGKTLFGGSLTVDCAAGNFTFADASAGTTSIFGTSGTLTALSSIAMTAAFSWSGGTLSGAACDITGHTTTAVSGGTCTVKSFQGSTTHSYTGGTTTISGTGTTGTTFTINGGTVNNNGETSGITGNVVLTSGIFNVNANFTSSGASLSWTPANAMTLNVLGGKSLSVGAGPAKITGVDSGSSGGAFTF